jgi:hypothetical protein
MKAVFSHKKYLALISTVFSLLIAAPVAAQDKSPDDWQYSFELYAWLPGLELQPSEGEQEDFKFKDILKNLDMGFFGDIEMRKQDWSLGLDMIYMNLGVKDTLSGEIIGRPGEVDVAIDMRGVISTLTAGHTIARTDKTRFDIIGGTRYIYIRNQIELDVEATPGEKQVNLGGANWDFLLGFEGKTLINDQWYVDYYADVGSGGSKLTWQAKLGMGYEFNKWTATFGVRNMAYRFAKSSDLKSLRIVGPYLGAKWSW